MSGSDHGKIMIERTEIDRRKGTTLAEQTADAIRREIASGIFAVGSTLPSRAVLAKEFGVSEKVTRSALEKLAGEGLICPRRRTGCEVIALPGAACRGHVLFVLPDDGAGYYAQSLCRKVSTELARSGYLTFTATIDDGRRKAASPIEEFASIASLAIVLHGGISTIDRLEEKGIRYLTVGERRFGSKQSAGHIQIRRENGIDAMVGFMRDRCVRKVVEVRFAGTELDVSAVEKLKAAKIRTETIEVKSGFHRNGLDDAQRSAHDAVARYLAKTAKRSMPDYFFFTDDYLAFGGIAAIEEAGFAVLGGCGVKSPRGIGVVSWYNRGFGPYPWLDVPRLEMDPYSHGEIVALAALAVLEKKANGRRAGEVDPLGRSGAELKSEFKNEAISKFKMK